MAKNKQKGVLKANEELFEAKINFFLRHWKFFVIVIAIILAIGIGIELMN